MQVSTILEYKVRPFNQRGQIIERITKADNASYLVKGYRNLDFPYLSEVEVDDPSTFDSNDMDAIIKELQRVHDEVTDLDDQRHIDDIIRLAKRCKENSDTVLVFV